MASGSANGVTSRPRFNRGVPVAPQRRRIRVAEGLMDAGLGNKWGINNPPIGPGCVRQGACPANRTNAEHGRCLPTGIGSGDVVQDWGQ